MRRVFIAAAILLALAAPAFCAAAAKPASEPVTESSGSNLNVPVYPGSTPVMEISIGEKDMLNWVTQILPAMASMSASSTSGPLAMIGRLDLAGLAAALQGLKQVKVLELSLPKRSDLSARKICDYYTAQLGKESGWTRVFWRSTDPNKSMAVYSLPNADGIFVTQVKTGPEGGRLIVGRTAGRIDLARIVEWAGKNLPKAMGQLPGGTTE